MGDCLAFKLLEKRPFFPKSDWEIRNVTAGTQVAEVDVARERHLSGVFIEQSFGAFAFRK